MTGKYPPIPLPPTKPLLEEMAFAVLVTVYISAPSHTFQYITFNILIAFPL